MKNDPRTARTSADYWYETAWKDAAAKGCVFCDLKDKYIIAEKDNVVLTVNLFPYIDGHLLIIPRRHYEPLSATTSEEWRAILYLANWGTKRLKAQMDIEDIWLLDRVNVSLKAGKTVAHAHVHLVPFSPDLFKWQFQPVKIHPLDLAKKLR